MRTFDITDPRWASEPGPLFDEIREQNPIHTTDAGIWVLTRYHDCQAALRDRRSSSDSLKLPPDAITDASDSERARDAQLRTLIEDGGSDPRPFLFRDPPDHTRLRGLVSKAFTPRVVANLAPFIEARADVLLDRCLELGEVDLQEALCYPLPVAVICELLGIPESDEERFSVWSEALARGLDPDFLLTDEAIATRDVAIMEFAMYFFELMAERKANPGDDLLSALALAEEAGDVLTEAEMLSTSILLLVAGHETTVNLLTGSVVALSEDRAAQQSLRDDPDLFRTAVDELMRAVSPVQLTARSILEDLELPDATIPGGSMALLLLASANRDPAVFEDPGTLDLARDPNPQLGFGFGLHHCLGAPLARLEARITLRRLLERTRSVEVAGEVRYRPNVVLRGVTSLPVSLIPA